MKRKYKTALVWTFLIVGMFGFLWWAGQIQSSKASAVQQQGTRSVLVSDKNLYDFSTISMANGLVKTIFKVTNPTDKDINVGKITTSCMCTNVYVLEGTSRKGPFGMPGHGIVPRANEIIKAGETQDIEVVYDPAAHGPAGVGAIDRFVYLEDTNGGVLQLEIKARVTP